MKKIIVLSIIAIAIIGNSAQADQYQQVISQFNQYNQSLANGTQYQPQPIQQGDYIYYPVPIQQTQQPVQQPQQQQQYTMTDARGTIQGATNIVNDVSTGIQTIRNMVQAFKGGY